MNNKESEFPGATIVELLKNAPAQDQAELQRIILQRLSEEERQDYESIIAGEKLPSFMSDTIAKRLFDAEIHSERLEYLFREALNDQTIRVNGTFKNEGYIQHAGSKKIIFDMPVLLGDGRRGDLEFQVAAQDFILTRGEIYGSEILMFQYSTQPDEKKSTLDYDNVSGGALVMLMRHSPEPFRSFSSDRYIHRFVENVSDSGLRYEPHIKTVYIQLDKCLEQFCSGKDGENNSRLQLLLSLLADSNNKKALEASQKDSVLSDMISETRALIQRKEVQAMMLAEKYAIADMNAIKHYERREESDLVSALYLSLRDAGRIDDMYHAMEDSSYRAELMKSFAPTLAIT